MKRIALAALSLLLVAAAPQDVLPDLEDQGFYIEAGSAASPSVVGAAVAEAGFAGGRLYVVVLAAEPSSGATFFSDAVLDQLGDGTVLTVAPETVGYASDQTTWDREVLDTAVDDSLSGADDNDVVARFVNSLTGSDLGSGGGEPVGENGGGSGGFVWFLVIGGGLLLLFLYLRRNTNRTAGSGRLSPQVAKFKEAAHTKLSEIANDILEMEDEVRLSENMEAKDHYQRASQTYAELIDNVDQVSNVDDLIDVVFRLDTAIWELDVAEALLDGKAAPSKPERPKVEAVETKPPEVLTQQGPTFDRRPQRQSSPTGPDLGSLLMAVLAMQNMGGFGQTPGQLPGGFGGSGRSRSSGGGMRGGMGGGRIRGGGRRRG